MPKGTYKKFATQDCICKYCCEHFLSKHKNNRICLNCHKPHFCQCDECIKSKKPAMVKSPGRKYVKGHWAKTRIGKEINKMGGMKGKGKKFPKDKYPNRGSRNKKFPEDKYPNSGTRNKKFPQKKYPNHGMRNKKHNETTKESIKRGQIERWKNPKEHEKMSKGSLGLWQTQRYQELQRKARSLKPNKQEQIINNILQKHFPDAWKYVGDFKKWIGGKNPDFIHCNGSKLLIEFFGTRWHYTDRKKVDSSWTKRKAELEKIKHFKKYGYKTLIIWDKELRHEDKIVDRVSKFMGVVK